MSEEQSRLTPSFEDAQAFMVASVDGFESASEARHWGFYLGAILWALSSSGCLARYLIFFTYVKSIKLGLNNHPIILQRSFSYLWK